MKEMMKQTMRMTMEEAKEYMRTHWGKGFPRQEAPFGRTASADDYDPEEDLMRMYSGGSGGCGT